MPALIEAGWCSWFPASCACRHWSGQASVPTVVNVLLQLVKDLVSQGGSQTVDLRVLQHCNGVLKPVSFPAAAYQVVAHGQQCWLSFQLFNLQNCLPPAICSVAATSSEVAP